MDEWLLADSKTMHFIGTTLERVKHVWVVEQRNSIKCTLFFSFLLSSPRSLHITSELRSSDFRGFEVMVTLNPILIINF
jgi:hypothetical protein